MLSRLSANMVAAIVFMVVSLIYFGESVRMAPPFVDGNVSMTFFPYIISIVTFLTALVLFFKGLKEKRGVGIESKRAGKSLAVVLMTCLFVAVFERIGFTISSVVYSCSLMFIFGGPKKRIVRNIFYAGIITLIIYVLFEKIFGVKLPTLLMEG